jgi:hypothetical protein
MLYLSQNYTNIVFAAITLKQLNSLEKSLKCNFSNPDFVIGSIVRGKIQENQVSNGRGIASQ